MLLSEGQLWAEAVWKPLSVVDSAGQAEASMGGTHFLMRRLKNVRSEMALNVLAYNIKRMVALLGVRGLMCAMRR